MTISHEWPHFAALRRYERLITEVGAEMRLGMDTVKRQPKRGEILPDRNHFDGQQGYEYDWLWVPRRPQSKRKLPAAVHVAAFVIALSGLCAATYADLGPDGYAAKAARLLDANGLQRVAGQIMKLQGVAEQATGQMQALFGLADTASAKDV